MSDRAGTSGTNGSVMKIGVPSEMRPGERRVAIAPDTAKKLIKLGFDVLVQQGAGAEAMLPDNAYEAVGATIVPTAAEAWSSDIVVRINPPCELEDGTHEIDLLGEGSLLIGLLWPGQNPELVERVAARGASAIALDKVPRISRAQKMDVLSSMANIAGYRAVLEACKTYGKPVIPNQKLIKPKENERF